MINAKDARLRAAEAQRKFKKNRLQMLSVEFGSWLEPVINEAVSNGDVHLSVAVVLDFEEESNLKWFLTELGYQVTLFRTSANICQLELRWEK